MRSSILVVVVALALVGCKSREEKLKDAEDQGNPSAAACLVATTSTSARAAPCRACREPDAPAHRAARPQHPSALVSVSPG